MAAKSGPRPHAFRAKLQRFGFYYGVEVPAAVSRAFETRGFVAVAGAVNGIVPFRGTLIPRGGGRHRIWLNESVRSAAAISLGDRVAVELRVDTEPRGSPAPEDLAEALRDEGVFETFNSLPPGRRDHIVRWIDDAVHDATREKRIAKTVAIMLGEHEKRLDRVR